MKLTGNELRRLVLDMAWAAGSGHLGGSFSCAEILAALYGQVARVDPAHPEDPGRDRIILSKGHAAPMLYACLAKRGYFPLEKLTTLRALGSPLQGHPAMHKLPGVDLSTGSLGLGLSAGVGMGLALLAQRRAAQVYVVMGDGECQEGQNWEAFMSLARWRLANVTPIIDENRVQLDGTVDEVQPGQTALAGRLRAFGLAVLEVDGHDQRAVAEALVRAREAGRPHAVVARTVKGKGVSFMEHQAAWHGKPLDEASYRAARRELEEGEEHHG